MSGITGENVANANANAAQIATLAFKANLLLAFTVAGEAEDGVFGGNGSAGERGEGRAAEFGTVASLGY